MWDLAASAPEFIDNCKGASQHMVAGLGFLSPQPTGVGGYTTTWPAIDAAYSDGGDQEHNTAPTSQPLK